MSPDANLRERAELCPEPSRALPLDGQAARRPHEVIYTPALAEAIPDPQLQRIPPGHGLVMVGEKKRAIVFRDHSSRENVRRTRQTLALCERYHYDVLVVDPARGQHDVLLDKRAQEFLRIDRDLPLITLQTPQLSREQMLSWLFSANTNMVLEVAKDGLRILADSHVDAPYAQKKLNRNTDVIGVSTHERLTDDTKHHALTSSYLIIAIDETHAQQLIRSYGTAHAVVHGGHSHDCQQISEMAARTDKKVAVFHPDPPQRLQHAGKISLSRLRADNAVVITTTPDMIRALKDLSRPTGGAPFFAQRPGTRNGGMVHAPQVL